MVLLRRLSKKMQVKCLAQCLVLDKCSVTTSCYYCHHYVLGQSILTMLFSYRTGISCPETKACRVGLRHG